MKKLSFFLMAMLVSLTSFAAALGEGYSKVTDITTLSAGDKVVLYCDDADLGITGWDGTKTATAAATGWVEYVVEAADGGVLLKDGDNYVALTAKNSFHYTATGSVCKVTAEGILYITLAADSKDYLLYQNANNGSPVYRMYVDKTGNAQYKPFYVYEVTGEGGSTEEPETPTEPEPEPDPEPTPDPEEPETPGVGGDEAPVDGIVIFDANNDHGTASTTAGKYTISKNGVTMGVSNGRLNDAAGGHYRIYKDAKLTITSTVGNIASVEITFVAEGKSQYGSAHIAEIEGYTYDGVVGTWTGNSTELVLTTTAQVRVTQIVVTLAEQGDDFVLAPSIAGEVNFLNSTTVTITAEAGLDIYYTLDGTEPTNASTKYTAPFELTETKTVKAIAYDGDKASSVVSKTFTKTALIGCAEASALASGKVAYMKPFDVVYVVEGAGYIYIQDETGVALIYDYNLDDQLKAGDHVEGFVGKSSPYNGLPELKPEGVTYDDLTVTPGTAPSPTVVTTVPVAADVNKYVQFNGVSFKDAVSFTSDNATNVTMLMGETEVTVRNSFKLEAELDADTMYNVVGFVAIYNSNIQIYFLSATESNNTGTGLDNITIDTNITKTIVNGQLIIIKDGVKYNAQGAVVK